MQNTTINYYNTNADNFIENTLFVDFSHTQQRFLSRLKKGAYILDFGCGSGRDTRILDFGCGSGRDTRYFLDQGYHVEAVDGSEEMCRLAARYTG